MIGPDWIAEQIAHITLTSGLIRPSEREEFLFNPTGGFYGFISQGTTDCLNEGVRILADHIQSRSRPVIEPWHDQADPLATWDQDYTDVEKAAPGTIRFQGPAHARISVSALNKHSPFLLGAILAHELTHHFLFTKNASDPDTQANEKLTDFCAVFLGFGKLLLNGYLERGRWQNKGGQISLSSYRLGYLSVDDIAIAHANVCTLRGLEEDIACNTLQPRSEKLVRLAFRRQRLMTNHPRIYRLKRFLAMDEALN